MEELRSTAIIDSEILEDSRKKAERILSHSLRECETILASTAKKIAEISKEKQAYYDNKVELYRREMFASLPLEQKRFLVEYEHNSMDVAIAEYFKNLTKDKKLDLITKLVKKYKDYLKDYKLVIKVAGFNSDEILSIVKKEYSDSTILKCEEIDPVLKATLESRYGQPEGMFIETEDKSRQCRIFLGELIEQVFDKNSYELATSLFSGGLPK